MTPFVRPSRPAPRGLTPLSHLGLALATGWLATGTASAQEPQTLIVGGPDTVFSAGHPLQGHHDFLGACGGAIDSMVADGEDLFLGDVTGNIYHYDSTTGVTDYSFTVASDATSLVIHQGDLLIGGTGGTILRVDRVTGALLDTLTPPTSVDSMLLLGDVLYVGSSLGVVHRTMDAATNDFHFFGTCGGPVQSMADMGTHLLLGTPSGVVYRILFSNGQLDGSFAVGNDASAMLPYAGDVLVAGSDATVRRVHAVDGTEFSQVDFDFNIQAMVLGATLEPGLPYCFGNACPCGNNDERAGCVTSAERGALLRAVGSPSVAADDLVLRTTLVAPNKFARYYMGAAQIQVPFGNGQRCAGTGPYGAYRFPITNSGPEGVITLGPGIVQHSEDRFPVLGQIVSGVTWNFQAWFRDGGGECGSSFNLTNAFSVTFEP